MTRFLVHAIATSRTEPPRGLLGLGGSALAILHTGVLAAYASALDEAVGIDALGRDALLEHHALVTALHDACDGVLPARFPTLTSASALLARLDTHQDAYRTALDRVRGRVEVAVTVRWSTPVVTAAEDRLTEDDDASTPGRRYLARRQAALHASDRARARAAEVAELLARRLPSESEVGEQRLTPSPAVAVSVAYLVARADVATVIQTLGQAPKDVRILINGPWPPYSFATVVREA